MSNIDDWVEGLSGRSSDPPEDAKKLREALTQSDQERIKQPEIAQEDDLRYQSLLRRLRKEGLLEQENGGSASADKQKPWPWVLSGVFASLFALAFALSLFITAPAELFEHRSVNFDQAPRYRGQMETHAVNYPASADSLAMLMVELREFGYPYQLAESQGQWILSFYVADISSDEASVWLREKGFSVSPSGWVVLRYDPDKD
ncbi:MAG: hypothetical protein AB2687_03470 [Candidatus Thiodiazotropha taylori]